MFYSNKSWFAVSFFLLCMLIFPLSLGSSEGLLKKTAVSSIWICVLFANLISLESLFKDDYQSGILLQYKINKIPFSIIVATKFISHWAFTGFPIIFLSPIFLVFLSGSFNDIFGDVFGDIFGGGARSQSRARRGSDLEYRIEVSLEDAINGKEIKISVPRKVSCKSCKGTGAKNGTALKTCSHCNGQGQVRVSQGFFSVQQTCPVCKGRGTVIEENCPDCSGSGFIQETKKLAVKIPAGVDNGDQIRLSGEGEGGPNNGVAGDLYVSVSVKPHKFFQRDGDDILCEVPISFTSATLGDKIILPTLEGKVELTVPAGTQSGRAFRIKNKGVKSVRSSYKGDLYCKVNIETPVNLTKEQKELLNKLDESFSKSKSKHRPNEKSWLDGIKEFFDK